MEIERNQLLQKQIDQLHQTIVDLKQAHPTGSPTQPEQLNTARSRVSGSSRQVDDQLLKKLQQRIDNLTDEKNALLDYIDENLDKFQSHSAAKNSVAHLNPPKDSRSTLTQNESPQRANGVLQKKSVEKLAEVGSEKSIEEKTREVDVGNLLRQNQDLEHRLRAL